MDEKAFIDKITTDLTFAADACENLLQTPKALRQIVANEAVNAKLIETQFFSPS